MQQVIWQTEKNMYFPIYMLLSGFKSLAFMFYDIAQSYAYRSLKQL